MNSVISGIFLRSWLSRAYTVTEKVDIWRGRAFSRRHLWETVVRTDLTAHPALARALIGRIEAPV